jgi:hypothetical protein
MPSTRYNHIVKDQVGDCFQSPLPSWETRNLAAGLAVVNKQKKNFSFSVLTPQHPATAVYRQSWVIT